MRITDLPKILKAKLSSKKDMDSWYYQRLVKCAFCPYNSKNTSFKKFTLRMWKWYLLNLFKPFCTICGCEITAKASMEIEECSLSEIGKEPKWVSIL